MREFRILPGVGNAQRINPLPSIVSYNPPAGKCMHLHSDTGPGLGKLLQAGSQLNGRMSLTPGSVNLTESGISGKWSIVSSS